MLKLVSQVCLVVIGYVCYIVFAPVVGLALIAWPAWTFFWYVFRLGVKQFRAAVERNK